MRVHSSKRRFTKAGGRWCGAGLVLLAVGGGARADDGDDPATADHEGAGSLLVYAGSHDTGDPQSATGSIQVFALDRRTGRFTFASAVPRDDQNLLDHPTFLALDRAHHRLFAVSENYFDPTPFQSAVDSFAIDPATGALSFISVQPTGFSFDPFEFTLGAVHLTVDPPGTHLIVALFGDAAVQVYPIDGAGALGVESQEVMVGTSPHEVVLSPGGDRLLVPCKDSDEIRQFTYDTCTGVLAPADPPSLATPTGAGPRHLTFSRDGRLVYLVDEDAATVNLYALRGGALVGPPLQSLTTLPAHPAAFDRARAAEVVLAPGADGLLYVSTRLDALEADGVTFDPLDGYVTAYRLDDGSGQMKLVAATLVGKEPRNFGVDPSGRLLVVANQFSDSIVSYRIGPHAGFVPLGSATVSHPEYVGITDRAVGAR